MWAIPAPGRRAVAGGCAMASNQMSLLTQLRGRLASIQRRLNAAAQSHPGEAGYLYAAGQLLELRNEKVFLLSLLDQAGGDHDQTL